MKFTVKVIRWVLFILFCTQKTALSHKTFVATFQSEIDWVIGPSTDEWIEFLPDIPPIKEFTACHWMKTKYFNRDVSVNLWSYCTVDTIDDTMKCLQIFFRNIQKSANRDLLVQAWVPRGRAYKLSTMDVAPFLHRSWIHFC